MVFVTGGAGFIGSHTCLELLNAGYEVLVADNLCNSSVVSLKRVEEISGRKLHFEQIDVCDFDALEKIFSKYEIDSVIHFAGLKAVGESVRLPIEYFSNNLNSALSLCKVMRNHNVHNLVFSSSATVYTANPGSGVRSVSVSDEKNTSVSAMRPYEDTSRKERLFAEDGGVRGESSAEGGRAREDSSADAKRGLTESSRTGDCTNPYGWTKYMSEQIFKAVCNAYPDFSVVLLRYFNPIGAHKSGKIGEDPRGIPNNLMPYISQVAVGRRKYLTVFGNDYKTNDGTGVRDYIHVVDLARAHIKALEYAKKNKGCEVFNIGTGRGTSVLELVSAFEKENGVKIPYVIGPRRPGDVDEVFADVSKAEKILGFKAEFTVFDMCRDAWNFQKNNPEGYEKA